MYDYEFNRKKNQAKRLKISALAIIGFLMLQGAFFVKDTQYFNKVTQEAIDGTTNIYKTYGDLQTTSKNNDQQQIIDQFNKLHSYPNAIADLLVAQFAFSLVDNFKTEGELKADEEFKKKYPKEAESYRIKVNDATQKIIVEEFLKHPKVGIAKERE